MNMRFICLVVLASIPLAAQAAPHKCKMPDGTLVYQEKPCAEGAVGMSMDTRQVSITKDESASATKESRAQKQANEEQQRLQAAQKAQLEQANKQNEEVEAYNKAQRCNAARRQLDILKNSAAVYRVDNNGDRHYLEDQNRQAELEAAQSRVAAECS
jgi:hypothetical protein